MEIIMRTPCQLHKSCNETSVGLLHRPYGDGDPRDDEQLCMVCEGVLREAKEALLKTGEWTCPVCGIVHIYVDGKFTPPLSYWYSGFKVSR